MPISDVVNSVEAYLEEHFAPVRELVALAPKIEKLVSDVESLVASSAVTGTPSAGASPAEGAVPEPPASIPPSPAAPTSDATPEAPPSPSLPWAPSNG